MLNIRARDVQEVEEAMQDLEQATEEVLQTRVIPNAVVERSPAEWIQAMLEEYQGLQKAVRPLDEATLDQWRSEGTPFEVIPAKVICSIKAPNGRRKVRCVCCGNFMCNDRWTKIDTYSGGIDAVTLRAFLRFAGLRRLDLGVIDVKQAFLSAPLLSNGVEIVVMTPAMFRRHGICQERYWTVFQALYGLTISPRSWAVFRDDTLTQLQLEIDGQSPQTPTSGWFTARAPAAYWCTPRSCFSDTRLVSVCRCRVKVKQ